VRIIVVRSIGGYSMEIMYMTVLLNNILTKGNYPHIILERKPIGTDGNNDHNKYPLI
jgi:hypothetical protein